MEKRRRCEGGVASLVSAALAMGCWHFRESCFLLLMSRCFGTCGTLTEMRKIEWHCVAEAGM